MFYGAHPGDGAITRLTGVHGNLSSGIIITAIIITCTKIMIRITIAGTFTVMTDGMIFISHPDDHILLLYILEYKQEISGQLIHIRNREKMVKQCL